MEDFLDDSIDFQTYSQSIIVRGVEADEEDEDEEDGEYDDDDDD